MSRKNLPTSASISFSVRWLNVNYFLTIAAFLLICSSASAEIPTLPVVTSNGWSVRLPASLVRSGTVPVTRGGPVSNEAPMFEDQTPWTKEQVCKAIKDNAPKGCNVNNFAPAPGISSPTQGDWTPNGCGPGGWRNAFLGGIMENIYGDSFTGDLDRPIKADRSINFKTACDSHDACYTSWTSKNTCDQNFSTALNQACNGKGNSCSSFAKTYGDAVRDYG